jgi:hypothetical protein
MPLGEPYSSSSLSHPGSSEYLDYRITGLKFFMTVKTPTEYGVDSGKNVKIFHERPNSGNTVARTTPEVAKGGNHSGTEHTFGLLRKAVSRFE